MKHKKYFDEENVDDQSVLNFLLERVRGLSIVSTPPLAEVDLEEAEESGDF